MGLTCPNCDREFEGKFRSRSLMLHRRACDKAFEDEEVIYTKEQLEKANPFKDIPKADPMEILRTEAEMNADKLGHSLDAWEEFGGGWVNDCTDCGKRAVVHPSPARPRPRISGKAVTDACR